MLAIPDRFLFVWSGSTFPYFARLAVESAIVREPDAEIELHLFGEQPSAAALAWLARRERASIHTFDPERDFAGLGVDDRRLRDLYRRIPARSLSARANLVRLAVLARRGGIYLDTDVLVIAPLGDLRRHEAFVGRERVLAIDNAWQAGRRTPSMIVPSIAWGLGRAVMFAAAQLRVPSLARAAVMLERWWQIDQVNNAVIGARPGAPFVRRLLEAALEADPRVRYALGPALVDRVARHAPETVHVLPSELFYAVPPSYSFRLFRGGALQLPPDTRLLHAVSSNHARLLAALDAREIHRRSAEGPYYAKAAELLARLEAA